MSDKIICFQKSFKIQKLQIISSEDVNVMSVNDTQCQYKINAP